MKEKISDGKKVETKQIGYRIPKEVLNKFDTICDERGLDHQAQLRMMVEAWIRRQESREIEGDD